MIKYVLYLVAIVLVILPGIACGLWTSRWNESTELEDAAAALHTIPTTIGDWDMQRTIEIPPQQMAMLEIAGYIAREYRHRNTGQTAQLFLTCGRPGPLSVHTPDVCYPGAGFVPQGKESKVSIPLEPVNGIFSMVTFKKSSALDNMELDLYWAWSAGQGWDCPTYPRWVYPWKTKVLHKIYLIFPHQQGKSEEDRSKTVQADQAFIAEAMAVIDTKLFKS